MASRFDGRGGWPWSDLFAPFASRLVAARYEQPRPLSRCPPSVARGSCSACQFVAFQRAAATSQAAMLDAGSVGVSGTFPRRRPVGACDVPDGRRGGKVVDQRAADSAPALPFPGNG